MRTELEPGTIDMAMELVLTKGLTEKERDTILAAITRTLEAKGIKRSIWFTGLCGLCTSIIRNLRERKGI